MPQERGEIRARTAHHGFVAHVPLEQRSTSRLLLGFVGTVVLPVAVAAAVILYCLLHFFDAFGDFIGHLPW
jgi:hypothetical protein